MRNAAKGPNKFNPAECLTDEETIVAFLNEAARDNDPAFLKSALSDVARSTIGMSALARATTGAGGENRYKALSQNGNADLGTIIKFLDALALRMTFSPREQRDSTHA
ncbi:putative addiction module antidote protein [Burkholderia sp. SG-MS1]|uniref:addiction module antidote protein n=1 Tax=Paraburkholderia sp. SG-MS1 TaxID=2023741 RepID=UPI0014489238|nr:addiction module antidote protein [Paraburkholderia sp. SG-MS1]NKJ45845.1 putative addiction module antidote protein [Paraburkholderia sp. SG-MS1]